MLKNNSTVLSNALAEFTPSNDSNLLIDPERSDSTAVYRLSSEVASINSVACITQPVPDPYWFGQLAAAHALGKVYALGGQPVTALNLALLPGEQRKRGSFMELLKLAFFPSKQLDQGMLKEVLRGGYDKVTEAGACLTGGQLLHNEEPQYGLCVNGVVHPERILTLNGAQSGDSLVLTKPLGTGVLFEAVRAGKYPFKELEKETLPLVTALNKISIETASLFDIHACVDVSDSGILGCLLNLSLASQVGVVLRYKDLSVYPAVGEMYQRGIVPVSNRVSRALLAQHDLKIESSLSGVERELLYDSQISGGLLLALPQDQAVKLLKVLHAHGVETACWVGEIVAGDVGIRVE